MIRLAVAVFGGAAAWSLHLVLSYVVLGLACRPDDPLLAPGGGVTALLVAISVVALLAAGASGLVAHRLRRGDGEDGDGAGPQAPHGGLASVGLRLNVLFAVAIVIGASAIAVLPPC